MWECKFLYTEYFTEVFWIRKFSSSWNLSLWDDTHLYSSRAKYIIFMVALMCLCSMSFFWMLHACSIAIIGFIMIPRTRYNCVWTFSCHSTAIHTTKHLPCRACVCGADDVGWLGCILLCVILWIMLVITCFGNLPQCVYVCVLYMSANSGGVLSVHFVSI